jgi:hypothetical protein
MGRRQRPNTRSPLLSPLGAFFWTDEKGDRKKRKERKKNQTAFVAAAPNKRNYLGNPGLKCLSP